MRVLLIVVYSWLSGDGVWSVMLVVDYALNER